MDRPLIFVAGHQGMVGSALVRHLRSQSCSKIVTSESASLDLRNQEAVARFFSSYKFDEVYVAAARVGGIYANSSYPADFIYDNLMIGCNIIHAAHMSGVQKLLFLGSSCIYPRDAAQPMLESALLSGKLEPTNEPYAVAKIASIKLCESYYRQYGRDYRSVMPSNLYGPYDNFHSENSHVVPALMRRFHEAVLAEDEEVVIWGSGTPRREFLHVDDMAAASIHVMRFSAAEYWGRVEPMNSHINVGAGVDCSIRELAEKMADVTGFRGRLIFDASKPDGAPRKLLDVGRLRAMGWRPSISLEEGLRSTYGWFLDNQDNLRR